MADLQLRIPASTFAKVALAAVLTFCFLKLWPIFLLFIVAALLALTLDPAACWIERRGSSRGIAVLILALTLLGATAAVGGLLGPSLVRQVSVLTGDYPGFIHGVHARLPQNWPFIGTVIDWTLGLPAKTEVREALAKPLSLGMAAGSIIGGVMFTSALCFYLLFDGKRLYAWLMAYVPRIHREKMARTLPEVSQVVQAYVAGQAITSVMVAIYSGIVLTLLHVPAALPLALLAGVCDVLPIIGVLIFIVPAVLLAFTVSPLTALAVFVLYLAYHLLENYVITPTVYGNRMRLSTLAVLLALVAGAELQGVLGMILILPVVAAYPILEKIWLRDYLSDEVLEDHQKLETAKPGEGEEAVQAILAGDD